MSSCTGRALWDNAASRGKCGRCHAGHRGTPRQQTATTPAAMTAADGEACAVVATAADIICSFSCADLAD